MEADDLKLFAVQLAALAERLDRRSEAAVERVERLAAELDRQAQRLASSGGQLAHEVSRTLQRQSGDIIGRGLAGSIEQFDAQIAAGVRNASAAAQILAQERQALMRERRRWLWLGCGALLVGTVLAVGASAYAVHHGRALVERHRIEAALLRAYNRADVTLCGDGLCANVDETGPRYGEHRQYRPVKPR